MYRRKSWEKKQKRAGLNQVLTGSIKYSHKIAIAHLSILEANFALWTDRSVTLNEKGQHETTCDWSELAPLCNLPGRSFEGKLQTIRSSRVEIRYV